MSGGGWRLLDVFSIEHSTRPAGVNDRFSRGMVPGIHDRILPIPLGKQEYPGAAPLWRDDGVTTMQ